FLGRHRIPARSDSGGALLWSRRRSLRAADHPAYGAGRIYHSVPRLRACADAVGAYSGACRAGSWRRRIDDAVAGADRRERPAVLGAILFGAGALSLLFALSSAGSRFDWTDWRLYAVLAFALGCLVSLVAWETRTSNPIIPVRLLATSVIWRSNIVVACFAA